MFKPYKYTKEESAISCRNIDSIIGYYVNQAEKKSFKTSRQYTKTIAPNIKRDNSFNKGSLFKAKILISSFMIIMGILILVTRVVVPVVGIYASSEDYMPVIAPIPSGFDARDFVSVDDKDKNKEDFQFLELSKKKLPGVEYVNVDGIEYPKALEEKIEERKNVPDKFYITIPKLNIIDAVVETNSKNFDPKHALGHYNGSCLPDEACNTFIFGHSTFKSTPNKYKKGDYTAVFARLDELEYGDEFFVNYRGKTYRYIVELTKIDKPENINPLEEPLPKSLGKYDNTVELFTCTPPGTTKYRLSVVGKYVE